MQLKRVRLAKAREAHRVACRSWRGPATVALALLLALASLLFGVSAPQAARADNRKVPAMPTDWQAPELRQHPLNGRIWSRAKGDFVTAQEYGTALARARFVLLGEVHDNADHHRLQAWAIRTISKLRGARLVEGAPQIDVIAMEMLTADERPLLDKFYGRSARVRRSRTADDFGRITNWDKLGWQTFTVYKPIIEAAIDANLVVTPANPPRAENRNMSKQGLASLPAEEVKRLTLDQPLADPLAADLAEEIKESHCGMLPESAIPNMSLVQRLRDARMADAMLVSDTKGAVLIAGNGHVRSDRGVPWYLLRRGIARQDIAIVQHIEVTAGENEPKAYHLADGDAAEIADFVVFTPRHPRAEPCEEMRRQMEAMKAHKKSDQAPAGTPSAPPPGDGAKSPEPERR